MQQHPSLKSNGVKAKRQNVLSLKANNMIFWAPAVVKAVLRSAPGRWSGALVTATLTKATQCPDMLRRFAANRNIALVGLSSVAASIALAKMPSRAPRPAVQLSEPVVRQTVVDHWQRAIAVINAALGSFQRIKSLNAAAARQLDSADYALTQLLHDLRPVMGLPADVSGLRAVLAEANQPATTSRPIRKALAA